MNLIRSLSTSGLKFASDPSEKRCILLSNRISLTVGILSFLLFLSYYAWYGWSFIAGAIPIAGMLCLATVGLNYLGFNILARFWMCVFIPLTSLALSIYSKSLYYGQQQELDYFTFRFITLASCIFPFILFNIKEKNLLFLSSLIGLALLMLHDPLHSLFHVGYHQNDMSFIKVSNYYFTNIVILATYLMMAGTVLFLKVISEKNEAKNAELIYELNKTNKELAEKNTEIEAQSMELTAQSETLNINQNKLIDAYREIQKHKDHLYEENINLASELIQKNADLTETNTELIKHNNELRQFSFTVSHNLRGPVASLLGLNQLIKIEKFEKEDQVILTHIKTSVIHLDTIIRDLNKIIDIRHDIFKIRQKINLKQELEELETIFQKEIVNYHVNLIYDIDNCKEIYSVKPMVHSILYNLISNAIKYRSPERAPVISITSKENIEHFIIQVKDNGIGIDLDRNKDNIFKLYKRFNHQTEGKGIGLYLVKLQCESLGGGIEVKSELNRFTAFTIYLKKPENIKMQILHDESYARVFYDAKMNATGVKWFGPISSDQYRRVFNKCLEFLKSYNSPNWLSDITDQGFVTSDDQHWMFTTILPEAIKNGLKRIACVKADLNDPVSADYVKGIISATSSLNVHSAFFSNFEQATNWIMEENEKAALKDQY